LLRLIGGTTYFQKIYKFLHCRLFTILFDCLWSWALAPFVAFKSILEFQVIVDIVAITRKTQSNHFLLQEKEQRKFEQMVKEAETEEDYERAKKLLEENERKTRTLQQTAELRRLAAELKKKNTAAADKLAAEDAAEAEEVEAATQAAAAAAAGTVHFSAENETVNLQLPRRQ
jgi:hypothetical protein